MSTNSLHRQLGLAGLIATGICSMVGASVYVVPFMLQRHVPGIGPYVIPAFLLAAVPALFAAFAYALLGTAMPRAGGSYVYASRGLSPYLGFIASFSQWFGLSLVIGVVAYVIPPFFRDVTTALGWRAASALLANGTARTGLALSLIWIFTFINFRGAAVYEKTVIPLMIVMFGLGGMVIVAGFSTDQASFLEAVFKQEGIRPVVEDTAGKFQWKSFLSASALLFASFIGFDSIAQAGGEARRPGRNIPIAMGITMALVSIYYMTFTGAVYHAVPYSYVAQQAAVQDVTAPGLLRYVLSPAWMVGIVAGASIALLNDLPAMLLSVSRLLFAWAEDGVFPKVLATLHPRYKTPYIALIGSGLMASVGVLGSHFAGDFFLGIDIMVTSMLVNFLLMCITLLTIDRVQPALAAEIRIIRKPRIRHLIAWAGIAILLFFLGIHILRDIQSDVRAWYFHSSPVWLLVMGVGSLLFFIQMRRMRRAGNTDNPFEKLP